MERNNLPLAGVRVLDFTAWQSGPACTQLLGFFGAEVIKIERPGTGEQSRVPDLPGQPSAFSFLLLNTNKRSITLDVKQPEGKELFFDLVRVSDVVIQNFAPGTAERLGINYETLGAINPGIIYASVRGFARGTEYENNRVFDPVAQAAGGAMSITGVLGGPPMAAGPAFADAGTALCATVGILMALFDRGKTRRGREVEVTLQEAVMYLCRTAFARQATTGEPARRNRNGKVASIPVAPSGVFRCKPGGDNDYCCIFLGRGRVGEQNWLSLLKVIGREELQGDPRFATAEARLEHEDGINAIVEEWTMQRTKFEVTHELGIADVPVAPVFDTLEISNDEALRRNGSIVKVEDPVRGPYFMPGAPVHMSGAPVSVQVAPELGEANEYVFSELLKLPRTKIESLREHGVI